MFAVNGCSSRIEPTVAWTRNETGASPRPVHSPTRTGAKKVVVGEEVTTVGSGETKNEVTGSAGTKKVVTGGGATGTLTTAGAAIRKLVTAGAGTLKLVTVGTGTLKLVTVAVGKAKLVTAAGAGNDTTGKYPRRSPNKPRRTGI
jgi:hypothetical protein